MTDPRNVLTPEALAMMDTIARTGSFAAAARELGKVPSALTYNVRQLEDALDVLLFDRSSRQAQLTAAGEELLNEGRRLLDEMDAVANRVRACRHRLGDAADRRGRRRDLAGHDLRAVRGLLCPLRAAGRRARHAPAPAHRGAGRHLGGTDQRPGRPGDRRRHAVARHRRASSSKCSASWSSSSRSRRTTRWPRTRARSATPSCSRHRAVAVADSAQRLAPITVNLLPGQDVLTVSSTQAKIEAQLRCMGCGFIPEPMARDARRGRPPGGQGGAAHTASGGAGLCLARAARARRRKRAPLGLALRWWLDQLESPATRHALLERHAGPWGG